MTLNERISEVVTALQEAENHAVRFGEQISARERRKYIGIVFGESDVFLVDKETGELYNTKGYGTPDQNKKLKADIGNIWTCDPSVLYTKRFNYLGRRVCLPQHTKGRSPLDRP